MFLTILISSILFYVSWTLVDLEWNYRLAKSMGIPLIRIPIDPLNTPFQVFEAQIWAITKLLRIPLPVGNKYMRRGWHFKDKADAHLEFGPAYALVTPRRIMLHLCDPEAIHQVFTRRHDFPRPAENYQLLAVYGPNISTASPENWARHRKVLATSFMNESIMRSVWDESVRQAGQMIDAWMDDGTTSVARDMRTVSLNVLAAIGFRRSSHFRAPEAAEYSDDPDTKFSYRDALQIVLDNVILIMLIPRKHLRYFWLPARLRRIGKAAADFGMQMQEMVDEEKEAKKDDNKGTGSLLNSFVHALDAHHKDSSKGMSVDELLGNLFMVNFAGHDTTTNTLAFAVLLLAACPEVQEWVSEEVVRVIERTSQDDMNYNDLFPKLVRCRAVMLETLRLFPPIMSLPKHTMGQPKVLQLGDREVTIPPHTYIQSQILALHTHPEFWPEPREWKPSRWVIHEKSIFDTGTSGEKLLTPDRKVYIPWSDGPQNCPGLKFSQVEFVAMMACLFKNHRVTGVREAKESDAEMRRRIREVVEDCEAVMLLKMRDPDRAKVRLSRVGHNGN